jgi:DNA mismatch endonuclease (patch repair protein)
MADVFTKEKRSEVMSKVKGRGNKSTELALIALFKKYGITEWRRHQKLPGKPDFSFPKSKLAVFVDGCFWHGCPNCGTIPKARRKFWLEKIEGNKRRDARVSRELRAKGWSVIRIRECRLKKYPETQVRRILQKLEARGQ